MIYGKENIQSLANQKCFAITVRLMYSFMGGWNGILRDYFPWANLLFFLRSHKQCKKKTVVDFGLYWGLCSLVGINLYPIMDMTMGDCEPTSTMGKRSFCRVKSCLGPRHFARPFSICATHRWTMFGCWEDVWIGWIFWNGNQRQANFQDLPSVI